MEEIEKIVREGLLKEADETFKDISGSLLKPRMELPIDVFEVVFLPMFAGELSNDAVKNTIAIWVNNIAGDGFTPVSLVDGFNEVKVVVPALADRDCLDFDSNADLGNLISKSKFQSLPVLENKCVNEALRGIGVTITRDENRWDELLEYFGVKKPTPKEDDEKKVELEDNALTNMFGG